MVPTHDLRLDLKGSHAWAPAFPHSMSASPGVTVNPSGQQHDPGVGKTRPCRLQGSGSHRTEVPWEKPSPDCHEPADAPELNTQRNLLCIYLFLARQSRVISFEWPVLAGSGTEWQYPLQSCVHITALTALSFGHTRSVRIRH